MDGWQTEYTRRNEENDTRMCLFPDLKGKWCWEFQDVGDGEVIEQSGFEFDTPEAAATAALKFYNEEWYPQWKETGTWIDPDGLPEWS